MHVGLILAGPDLAIAGAGPPPGVLWPDVQERARIADGLGFHSIWLTDDGPDSLVMLGALARVTSRTRLGCVFGASRRPPAVLAKALSTVDVVSGGRLVVGLETDPGHEDGYVTEAYQILVGMFGGGPFSFAGNHFRIVAARCLPVPLQRPHPPMWICGDGDGALDAVARHADGWMVSGAWTPQAYGRRLAALSAACERSGRDPATVTRSLCTPVLVGEDDHDLERRFRNLGVGGTLDEWRQGRLVGTVDDVTARLGEWEAQGVDTLVLAMGGVPHSATEPDDLAMLASACSLGGS